MSPKTKINAGDTHVWTPGTQPPTALCGYTPEVTQHEADDEAGNPEWTEITHAEPTGVQCKACVKAGIVTDEDEPIEETEA